MSTGSRAWLSLGLCVLLSVSFSCSQDTTIQWQRKGPLLVEVGADIGLDTAGIKEAGIAWVDLNGDGFLDVVANTDSDTVRTRLYYSSATLPDPTYDDVTETHAPGLLGRRIQRSVVAADLNHDGYVDLARNGYPVNNPDFIEVYLNAGPGGDPPYSFGTTDYELFGVPGVAPLNTEGMAWLDFDNDGWLDLILEDSVDGIEPFKFLRNPADGSADLIQHDMSTTGLEDDPVDASGEYLSVADIDADGDVDILARKDSTPDLWINQGDGTFVPDTGLDFTAPNENKGAVIFCDFDNDGDFDFFWTDGGSETVSGATANQVFLQTDPGVFEAAKQPLAVPAPAGSGVDGADCGDVDNDGDLDLFLANEGNDVLYLNTLTDGTFSLVPIDEAELDGADIGGDDGASALFGDYDRDGDLDLLVHQSGNNQLWRNRTNTDTYLMVQILTDVGAGVFRNDIGATARLLENGVPTGPLQQVGGGRGKGSQGPPILHFGLPRGADRTYQVEVYFQRAHTRRLVAVRPSDLGAYHLLTVTDSE